MRLVCAIFLASLAISCGKTADISATAEASKKLGIKLCSAEERSENVVASVIPGKWVIDKTLYSRLAPTEPGLGDMTFEFKEDLRLADSFPALKNGVCAYSAGVVTFTNFRNKNESNTYNAVLVVNGGNMTFVWREQNREDGSIDLESSILSAARTDNNKNDILFLGNDFNEGDSLPFIRVSK